jgi:hypothetical protein
VRSREPGRLVDLLIAGAFIEARSAERFAVLAPALDAELGSFYSGLLAAEARHCRLYLCAGARAERWAGGAASEGFRGCRGGANYGAGCTLRLPQWASLIRARFSLH